MDTERPIASLDVAAMEPSRAEQWRLIGAGSLLVVGLFADGFAHSNFVDELESFVTPWHGLVAAGYLACLAVIAMAIRARLDDGRRILQAVPLGWQASALGLGLFATGFIGDGIWHTIFGIEIDLDALFSPTHLLMLAGGLAIMSGPLQAQWLSAATGRRATLGELGPALVATTLIMATGSFFLNWTWPVNNGHPLRLFSESAASQGEAEEWILGLGTASGIAAYLVFAVLLVAPILHLARRWYLPRGAVVLITIVPWILLNAAFMSFFAWQRLIPVLLGALAIEFLLTRLQDREGIWTWRLMGAALPLLVFGFDMVVLEVVWGLGWSPELVVGSVIASAFVGYGVSVLTHPAASPARL